MVVARKDLLLFEFMLFIGFFTSYFFSASYSMFLDYGASLSRLAFVYLASGFLGILLSKALNVLRQRGGLFFANQVFLLTAFLVSLSAFKLGDSINPTNGEQASYLLMIVSFPFITISFKILHGLFTKLYEDEDSIRLFGKVRSAEVVGAILGYFSVLLIDLNTGESWLFFLPASASLLGASIVLVRLRKHYRILVRRQNVKSRVPQVHLVRTNDKYMLILGICIALGCLATFYVDFGLPKST